MYDHACIPIHVGDIQYNIAPYNYVHGSMCIWGRTDTYVLRLRKYNYYIASYTRGNGSNYNYVLT